MGKIVFLSLTGGEPFLRKELPQIAETFCKNNGVRKLSIPTNGSLTKTTVEVVKHILENCKNTSLDISISIDGIEEDNDKIRGKGSFKKAVATYNELKKLKKDYKKLGISIVTTLNALNQDKIMEIYDYIKNKLPEATFSVNLIRGVPKNPKTVGIDINKYELITNAITEDYKKNKFNKNAPLSKISTAKNILRSNFIAKTYKNKKYLSQCYAGKLSGVIYENGDVYPCELLSTKIGNIKDYDYNFKKLWKSENATKIIESIKKDKCFCTHECFWTTNILFNPKFHYKLLLESIKL